MGSLSIRKLDENVLTALKIQAAQHGVSMEEEARQILARAVKSPKSITAAAKRIFGKNGIDLDLPKHKSHKPLEFK